MIRIFAILGLFFSFVTNAEQKPLVIYISGANSTQAQANCWAAGFKGETGLDTKGYSYPTGVTLNHGSDKQANGIALINRMAADLSSENRPLIIVGHSSGSDLANALASKLAGEGKNVAHLYDLEGYGVPKSVSEKVPSTCVTAHDAQSGLKSLYWSEAHSNCDLDDRPISGCNGSKFCLHFRLANRNASPGLNKSNYGPNGYESGSGGCKPNLEWFHNPPANQKRTDATDSNATT